MANAQETAGYCWYCERRTRHVRKGGPSALLNVALTAVTLGLWLPLWLAWAGLHRWQHPYRCQVCGTPLGQGYERGVTKG